MPEPPARAGRTARRFAALAATLAGTVLACRRLDLVGTDVMAVCIALATGLALAAVVALAITVADIWRYDRAAGPSPLLTLVLAVAALAPASLIAAALGDYPAIDLATTRPDDPPALDRRAVAVEPPVRLLAPADRFAALQRDAYPDLGTLTVDLSPLEAYSLARRAAADLGWVEERAAEPASETADGGLTYGARDPIWGATGDVAVRIRPNGERTDVDLTSRSDVPLPDLGENARNIRAFSERFRTIARRADG